MKDIKLIGIMFFLSLCSYFVVIYDNTYIQTTTGQELIDLQQALDAGAITQEEYDELKLKIIERLDATPVDSTKTN